MTRQGPSPKSIGTAVISGSGDADDASTTYSIQRQPKAEEDSPTAESASDQETIPFPTDYVESRMNAEKKVDANSRMAENTSDQETIPFPAGHVEAGIEEDMHKYAYVEPNFLITSLQQIARVNCRVLIQPNEPHDFEVPDAKWVTLRPFINELPRPGDGPVPAIKCLAIHESPDRVQYDIRGSVNCTIYFSPAYHAIQLENRSGKDLYIANPYYPELADNCPLTIHDRKCEVITPGPWVFRQAGGVCAFQAWVFPSKLVLDVIAPPVSRIAGSKRGLSQMNPSEPQTNKRKATGKETTRRDTTEREANDREVAKQDIPTNLHLENYTVVKRISCLSQLADKEMAHVHTLAVGDKKAQSSDFTLYRMRRIGNTHSSIIFQARHSKYPGKPMAIKIMKKAPGPPDFSQTRRWSKEIEVHCILECDYIVRVLGVEARLNAIFLESIDGKDLGHITWCKADKMFRGTLADAQAILDHMGQAIHYLRDKGVLHNDIKPSNIIYTGKRAVLIDFGLGTMGEFTEDASGTPWYVAPEFLGQKQRSTPAEVWALGIVMLYLLCRIALPESGLDVKSWLIWQVAKAVEEAVEQMKKWVKIVEIKAQELRKDGGSLHALVSRMVEPRPRKRITIDELVDAVRGLLISENDTNAEVVNSTA
ncbi:putative serine threonine protein kinase-like protein [Rosellinia necatrix]|uniref:Putative serine threonine protein kinase-like protein n=1 Tax=Rosellinia necatrix TaxID=77044 RepID=A0A1W2TWV6_ROSNE|nr:putative serine threonine protein kinase-like protein [Rosellinia necatrix]